MDVLIYYFFLLECTDASIKNTGVLVWVSVSPCIVMREHKSVYNTILFHRIQISKCTSRHNGVHFLNIATSKSAPRMVCFAHVDFEMCFVPQRRAALFEHLNCPRSWGVFSILTSKCASRHSSVQFLISPVTRWLRTRRFSKPTFSALRSPQNIARFRGFPIFSHTWSSVYWVLSLLWLFGTSAASSVHRKFDF